MQASVLGGIDLGCFGIRGSSLLGCCPVTEGTEWALQQLSLRCDLRLPPALGGQSTHMDTGKCCGRRTFML